MARFGAQSMRERSLHVLAWAYLLLLPLDIHLRGPLFLHDLLAPVLAVLIADRSTWCRLRQAPLRVLVAFLGLAAATTALHCRGMADYYEVAIFAYMAVLFLAFVRLSLEPAHLALYAVGVLAAMFCYSMTEIMVGMRRSYEIYEGSNLSFIAQRFFFTFKHPNLVGSFYALPIACLLIAYSRSGLKVNRKGAIVSILFSLIMCIPLALSVSRHMLISIFLLSAFMMCVFSSENAVVLRRLLKTTLASLFLLFYLTIIFPFFPLGSQFPYINISTLGMYMIHQTIYLRMSLSSVARFIAGFGRTGLHETYPLFADRRIAHAVLSQYGQESLTDTFVTYMDAHNEYLNLAVLFGVPAMLLCVAFWAFVAVRAWRGFRLSDAVPASVPQDAGGSRSPGKWLAAFRNGPFEPERIPDRFDHEGHEEHEEGICTTENTESTEAGTEKGSDLCRSPSTSWSSFFLCVLCALCGREGILNSNRSMERDARRLAASLTLAFVLGVLLAALWDDILSKRWIWITLGLLVGCLERSSTDTDT